MPILVNSKFIDEINIVDAFCGKGEYDDGGIGSPIETFNSIQSIISSNLYLTNPTKINHIVNDINKDNIENVRNYIDSHGGVSGWNYKAYNHDFEDFKTFLLDLVNSQSANSRTLIFLDPYGYKNIDKSTIVDLTKNGRTEIVLWLPIANMKRFIDKSKQSDEAAFLPLKHFLDAFFPNQLGEVYSKMDVFEFINKIKDKLKINNLYATSYYIERDSANFIVYSLLLLIILDMKKY
ncbi:MAG: three-Cys-motif partner protein TcmP [Saprospiraceae bacterium]|nr:three-Cys-motif partner protein TcmP [Saprospiraceae bacterium]